MARPVLMMVALEADMAALPDGKTLPRVLILAQGGACVKNIFYGGLLSSLGGRAEACVLTDHHGESHLREMASESGVALSPFLNTNGRRGVLAGRLEAFVVGCWDSRGVSRTRLSKRRLTPPRPRNGLHAVWLSASKLAQKAVARTRLLEALDSLVERLLLRSHPTSDMIDQLREWAPDVVLSTAPHRSPDMAVARAARRLGVPVLACVSSWDNLTGKDRITFTYDGYLLWSEQMKSELHALYERSHGKPWRIVGAPNFDAHFDGRWRLPREEFCRSMGLDPARKIILYGTGSRGLASEHLICERLAERIRGGELDAAQLLVRVHPLNDDPAYDALAGRYPELVVRHPGRMNLGMLPGSPAATADGVVELINSLLHAELVINLASTLTIDAAILDRPVVNVAYDPVPVAPGTSRIRDIYTVYDHYQPIVKSGGVRLAESEDELVAEIRRYLSDPSLEREARRSIVDHEVGVADGRAGERIVEALLQAAEGWEARHLYGVRNS